MAVINKAIDLVLLFLVSSALIIPFAASFYNSFFNGSSQNISGMSTTIVGGIILICVIVFLFSQIKQRTGK